MDIRRSDGHKSRVWLPWASGAGVLVLLAVLALWLGSRPPAVDRDDIWTATVTRDALASEITASGELVAQDLRAITNRSEGVVERIQRLPGDKVAEDDALIEMSSPGLEEELAAARWELEAEEADFRREQMETADELLELETQVANAESDVISQRMEVDAKEDLAVDGSVATIELERARLELAALERRHEAEKARLERFADLRQAREAAGRARLARQEQEVERLERQVTALSVTAGTAGVVQDIEVEEGERIGAGEAVARVVNPDQLIARIRVPERQAGDLAAGMPTYIDARGEEMRGELTRVDPAVRDRRVEVDVALPENRPGGLRPDLSVRARVELDRVEDTLVLERPPGVDAGDRVTLFRITPDGRHAEPVTVHFGRASATRIEIREGVAPGDELILSDMGGWQDHARIRVR